MKRPGGNLNLSLIEQTLSPRAPGQVFLVRIADEAQAAADASGVQVEVEELAGGDPALATMTGLALQFKPQRNEVWLAARPEGAPLLLITPLSSEVFKLHPKTAAAEQSVVLKTAEKIYLTNDQARQITENAVLGQQLKSRLETLIDQLNSLVTSYNAHIHVSASFTATPTLPTVSQSGIAARLATLKAGLKDMLSQITFLK